jgi:hypothetical protein
MTGATILPMLKSNSSRRVLPSLLLILLPAICNAQDATDKNQKGMAQVSNGASVAGRAVFEDSSQPATRYRIQLIAAAVLLSPLSTHRIPTVVTDPNGQFNFRTVGAGEYYVVAGAIDEHRRSAPPFPIPTGDAAADAAKMKQFKKENLRIAVDGLHNLEVNLRLPNPHFGTISGRVLGDQGTPVAGASVHLMRKDEDQFGASVLTNEQGEYRFLGLPAGDYIISASPALKERSATTTVRGMQGLPGATYFPSTLSLANSPPVTVLADRDRGDVVITLISRRLYSLAGMVRTKTDGQPVTNAVLRLSVIKLADDEAAVSNGTGIESAMSNYGTSPDSGGHWTFENVPDGRYRLLVVPKPEERSKPLFVQVQQELTVQGSDIQDLVIDVSAGTRISGSLVVEGNGPSPQFVRVAASQYKSPSSSSARLDGPGSFALTAVPSGEVQVSAFAYPQDQFYVKSIEANGVDLLRSNLTIAEGEQIQDMRIVISNNVGVVMGRVISQNGNKPIPGINVLLRRVADDKLRLYGGKLTATTDEAGNFRISGAPGVYLVVAWRTQGGPTLLEAIDKAQREQSPGMTLSSGDTKQLEIRLP